MIAKWQSLLYASARTSYGSKRVQLSLKNVLTNIQSQHLNLKFNDGIFFERNLVQRLLENCIVKMSPFQRYN